MSVSEKTMIKPLFVSVLFSLLLVTKCSAQCNQSNHPVYDKEKDLLILGNRNVLIIEVLSRHMSRSEAALLILELPSKDMYVNDEQDEFLVLLDNKPFKILMYNVEEEQSILLSFRKSIIPRGIQLSYSFNEIRWCMSKLDVKISTHLDRAMCIGCSPEKYLSEVPVQIDTKNVYTEPMESLEITGHDFIVNYSWGHYSWINDVFGKVILYFIFPFSIFSGLNFLTKRFRKSI